MITIVLNVLDENIRKKVIYIIAIIGMIMMLLISTGQGLSINGIKITDFEQRVPVAIALNTCIGSLIAIIISLQTIPNEIERKTTHLILSRGVKRGTYMLSLTLGNMITSFFIMVSVNFSLFIFTGILGRMDLLINVVLSVFILSINAIALSVLVSFFSIFVPRIFNTLLAILIYFLGVFHGMLSVFANAVEGLLGDILIIIMKFIPDLAEVQNQASNALMSRNIDFYPLLLVLILVYIVLSFTFITYRKEV